MLVITETQLDAPSQAVRSDHAGTVKLISVGPHVLAAVGCGLGGLLILGERPRSAARSGAAVPLRCEWRETSSQQVLSCIHEGMERQFACKGTKDGSPRAAAHVVAGLLQKHHIEGAPQRQPPHTLQREYVSSVHALNAQVSQTR